MFMHIIIDLIICGVGLLKMINLRKSTASLNPKNSWDLPIDDNFHFSHNCLKNFDQNGYDLTSLEREYAIVNGAPLITDGWRSAVKQPWFECDSINGPHIDHAYLYERKTFSGAALDQMLMFAEKIPLAYKVIRLRAKWGIDVSIDYVSKEHAFELFHYEWDDFNLDNVLDKQYEVEKIILNTDWDDAARTLIRRKDEWHHLDYSGQDKFKSDFYGLSPDRYFLVAWD